MDSKENYYIQDSSLLQKFVESPQPQILFKCFENEFSGILITEM